MEAVRNLIKKIEANAEHREAGRLLFAHLPTTVAAYTIIRLEPISLVPMRGDWLARDHAEERRLVEEVRQRGDKPCKQDAAN
jgi:hypothetical protein